MNTFNGAALRASRKEKGFTQEKLAEMVGCEVRYLRDLESGKKNNPSFLLVVRICSCLGIQERSLSMDIPAEQTT